MLIEKPTEKFKYPYDLTHRANSIVGLYSAVYADPQFSRIEKNPESQQSGKNTP
jgi:hypothetical protein